MSAPPVIGMRLLAGGRELLAAHSAELPQRDDICGAFCGALALRGAGITSTGDGPLDQDAVALAAGSIVSSTRDPATLPGPETGRRDYRLPIPVIEDPEISGTTAAGVVAAIEQLGAGTVVPIALSGPWTAAALDAFFTLTLRCERPVSLIANLATHHLWGGRPSAVELLACLYDGSEAGPPPDWDVGHFSCIVGRIKGTGGSLYIVADTYPALGVGGVHLQPTGRLAAAIDRPDKPSGGVIVVAAAEEAERLRGGAAGLGLREELWDNGTVEAGAGE